MLHLEVANFLQQVVIYTHAKFRETIVFKMCSISKKSAFEVPLILEQDWMMGVKSLEVKDSVYYKTPTNNKIKLPLKTQQLGKLEVDTQFVKSIEYLYKVSDAQFFSDDDKEYKES